MSIGAKREALNRLIKATYISAQKFAETLAGVPEQDVASKLGALAQYFKKKGNECKELEEEIEKDRLREEKREENEVALQIVDYLGRKGMVRTAEKIVEEMRLEGVVNMAPYREARRSVRSIVERGSGGFGEEEQAEEEVRRAKIVWEFAKLCREEERRERALEFCKDHKNDILGKHLPLLVLSRDSALFRSLAEKCSAKKLGFELSLRIAQARMGSEECALYRRVALGVSGFTTPACKERENAECPGCSERLLKLSKDVPRSIRSTTRILCSKTKSVIAEDTPIFASLTGEVFCKSAIFPEDQPKDELQIRKLYRRCYFA